ncbi:TGS domain-containing protein, partial [Alloalcanivorax xenomutans]|uniref:TGS domain-containing protein n=1 Tax=Alloalcanivorax xenomutans TaxID=1094342 RepID=UPI003C45480C
MPKITLPDGSTRSFDKDLTIADVALDIGEGLARAALAGKVNNQLVDLSYTLTQDAEV